MIEGRDVDWRLVVAGVLLVGVGLGLAVGTGAVSVPGEFSPLAEEGDEIEGAETGREVFLAPADTLEGETYADLNDEGDLELDVSELPPSAETTLDDVFVVGFEPENETTSDGDVRTARIGVDVLEEQAFEDLGLESDAITFLDATGDPIADERDALPGGDALHLNAGDHEAVSVRIDTRDAAPDSTEGGDIAASETLTLSVLADVRVGVEDLRVLEQPTDERRLIGTGGNPDEAVPVEVGVEDRDGNLIEGIERDEAVTVELVPLGDDDRDRVVIAEGVDVDDGVASVDLRDFAPIAAELGPAGPLGGYEIEATIDADATAADDPITITGTEVELVHRAIDVSGDGATAFATPIDLDADADVRTTFTTPSDPDPNESVTDGGSGPGAVADNPVEAATISRFDGPGIGPSGGDGRYEVGFADDPAQQVHQGHFLQIDAGDDARDTERIGLVYREGDVDQPGEFELEPGAHLLGTAPNTADPREYEAALETDAGVAVETAFEPGTGTPLSDVNVGPTDAYWVVIEDDGEERFVFVPGFDPEEE